MKALKGVAGIGRTHSSLMGVQSVVAIAPSPVKKALTEAYRAPAPDHRPTWGHLFWRTLTFANLHCLYWRLQLLAYEV